MKRYETGKYRKWDFSMFSKYFLLSFHTFIKWRNLCIEHHKHVPCLTNKKVSKTIFCFDLFFLNFFWLIFCNEFIFLWITHTTFFLRLCLYFKGQQVIKYLVFIYLSTSNVFTFAINVYGQRIRRFWFAYDFIFSFEFCVLILLSMSHDIFVGVIEILWITTFKMKSF